jgi:hypothetical protein
MTARCPCFCCSLNAAARHAPCYHGPHCSGTGPDCAADDYVAEAEPWPAAAEPLGQALDRLERTDPTVAAAKRRYDRARSRLLGCEHYVPCAPGTGCTTPTGHSGSSAEAPDAG